MVIHIVAVLAQLGERQTEVPPNFNLQLSEGRVFKPHRSQLSFFASIGLVARKKGAEVRIGEAGLVICHHPSSFTST